MSSRERVVAGLFALPACVLIGLFVFWPAVNMAFTSLHRQDLTDPAVGPYCGAENYRVLWQDDQFRAAARNTAYFAILVVPLQTALALLLAMWTNRPRLSTRVLRLAVFIPTAISLTVLSVLWKLLYEPAGAAGAGLLNGLLSATGLPHQPFLTSPAQALPCIVVMSIWQGVGFQMAIFLAGLQTIPQQHYEAASLDGAGRWRSFLHVTLPGVAPTAVVVVMITTIFALKLFVQPYLMTGGGPRNSTVSLVQYMYNAAFARRDLGLACAAGLVFFIVVATIAVIQRVAMRKAEALQ
jgi:ABC-type sugar transport system permease subunit